MKTLVEKINESIINEASINDNPFFNIYKAKSCDEFMERMLGLKNDIKSAPVDMDDAGQGNMLTAKGVIRGIQRYKISSPDNKKYYIGFCTKDKFEERPTLYFGTGKKFYILRWQPEMNESGKDTYEDVSKITFFSEDVYEMPDSLIPDCVQITKKWK
jgi:hypothetical protein